MNRKSLLSYLKLRIQKQYLLIALLLHVTSSFSQEDHSSQPEKLSQISFEEFVMRTEEKTTLKFFYIKEWTNKIQVNPESNEPDIYTQLQTILEPQGINFMVENNLVILYKGKEITDELPDYSGTSFFQQTEKLKSDIKLTNAEEKYIEAKKETSLKTITIGKEVESVNDEKISLSGRVFDKATGEPLIGATIYIRELGIGSATDLDGHFNLFVSRGRYFLTASSLSMKEEKFYVQVYSDGTLSIPMEKELVSINEVKIVAERNHNVTGIQMGYERISNRTIREIPAVMGEKDILRVAQMLPGVQSAGEGSSGLIVRGGSADQNLFYINKLPIYNTAHLFGFFSAFNPEIINNFSLYKSNIPANYGGRVSSVFDISTRQGNKKEFFGKGGISPVTANIVLEGPLVKDKSSFVLSYRGTYSDWILSRIEDINIQKSNASFYDISGSIHSELNDKNLLKVFAYKSADKFTLSNTNDYSYSNAGGSMTWKHKFARSTVAEFSLTHSQYDFGYNDKVNPSEAYTHDYRLNHSEFRTDILYIPNNRHRISYGLVGIYYSLDRGKVLPYDTVSKRIPIDLGIENAFESAVYVSDEIKLFSRLTLLAGLRYSMYMIQGPAEVNQYYPDQPIDYINIESVKTFNNNEIVKFYHGPEPRLAFNYLLGKNTSIKFSYNRTRQYIFLLSNTIAISPTDQWKLADYHLQPQLADQLSVGYYHNFNEQGISISTELYKKWIEHVVEYRDGIDFISSDPSEMLLLQGKQNAYGAEFMIKKNTGKFSGWLAYSYSRSFIQVESDLPDEQINFGEIYPSNYDKPHSLNIVTNYKNSRRLSFSAILVYSTGRPITYPAAKYYSEGKEVLHYSKRNEYRIPDYFRIDVSINFEGNLLAKKWIHSSWSLNIYNITGRKNAYSVYFEAKDANIQGYKLSIFAQPVVTLTWNFKFGNYASE